LKIISDLFGPVTLCFYGIRNFQPLIHIVRRLDTLSGNKCAAPNCTKSLVARDNETIISKICHIEAASENGPRFNPEMTDDERRHFDNLILLCDECHSIIDNKDNEQKYPVSLLKEWKRNHESKQLYQLNLNPSLLTFAINVILNTTFDETDCKVDESIEPFKIEDKIKYNAIKRNKSLIDEYKIFYTKISSLYNELEIQGSFKKEVLHHPTFTAPNPTLRSFPKNTANGFSLYFQSRT